MNVPSRFRELLAALSVFSFGAVAHFRRSVRKKEEARYCAMCQEMGHPLSKVSFMIRTGLRRGMDEATESFMVMEIHVCGKHHPDKDVSGATLAHETQKFLAHNGVSAECVYYYKTPEHVFRLG